MNLRSLLGRPAPCPVEAHVKSRPWMFLATRRQGVIVVTAADAKPYDRGFAGQLTADSPLRRALTGPLRTRSKVYFQYDHRGQLKVM